MQPYVAVSRADALALGVSDGDRLEVGVDGHQVVLPARVDGVVPEGVVAIPGNLDGRPAEALLGGRCVFGPVKVTKG